MTRKITRASKIVTQKMGGAETTFLCSEYSKNMVSIIIPVFNRAEMVCETLDSLAKQDYSNVELMLVDDGSTDNLKNVIELWAAANSAVKLRLFHQPKRGAAAARNLGMRRSTGEFVYFLDSDDLVLPQSLSLLVAALEEAKAPYALGRISNTDMRGTILNDQSLTVWNQSREAILLNQWMTHAALYRRSAICAIGLYDETLQRGEDTEFHWRMVAKNGLGAGIDTIVAHRRLHSLGQLSDLDGANRARQTNAVFNHFQKWALEHDLLTPVDRIILRRRHLRNAVQSGSSGNWSGKEQSLTMIRQLYPNGLQLTQLLGRPKLRVYYFILKLLISPIEMAVGIIRRRVLRKTYKF